MQENLQPIIDWLNAHDMGIIGVFLSVGVSVIRSIKKRGKIDWLEAVLCGGLTLTMVSTLEYLNIPMQISIFVGGIIGFKGTLWVDHFINKKLGDDDEQNNQ